MFGGYLDLLALFLKVFPPPENLPGSSSAYRCFPAC